MKLDIMFFANASLMGVGLAMDAFSVSMANGLGETKMNKRKQIGIASTFALFQFVMPMLGWIGVFLLARAFSVFRKFIPWISILLLGYIGGKMIYESLSEKEVEDTKSSIGFGTIIIQGIATSIDALCTGFTISDYGLCKATLYCLIIGIITFVLCIIGINIGKKVGLKLAGKAEILGGVILVLIGIEIFIKGI